ncbi:EAL domain-containing protein [Lichenihabitans sp. PAMC28606]|uniref:putative bifunctional diguanylate cyclase/phosphodiesterase n=1 Tax=Lichenihabitans sp. PAMC28606 TaxID=2880932 RepID=UPI001D0AD1C1|nr:EAL domain-containing protein [Lichenihabitans sp. PAMC28606]UDL95540.1 EAL domain-containing protein [Lichenihabitans sp. PAMC28606]
MRAAPMPIDEDARLARLAEYQLGDQSDDPTFDHLVQLTSRLFGVPVAFVSFMERERQVFYCKIGFDLAETDRRYSFCAHTISRDALFFVLDAALDPRFHDNPQVTDWPFVRFYAGVPLRSPSGHAFGTLCILDHRPRNQFSERDAQNLTDLGKIATDLFEKRRLNLAREASQSRFQGIAASSPDGIICCDQEGHITVWNEAATQLFGYASSEAIGQSVDIIVSRRAAGAHNMGMMRVVDGGAPRLIGKTIELPARHKDGTEFPIELSLSMWCEDGRTAFGSIVRDIRERRANEEQLFSLAHHDPLTALPNRMVLSNRISEATQGGQAASILVIDLDGFKEVNDALGHSAGDQLLQMTAKRLLDCVRPTDTVARIGGDEFAVVLVATPDLTMASRIAALILTTIAVPFAIDDEVINLGASIGIALGSTDNEAAEDLLSRADLALYRAKGDGRNCFRQFTPDLKQTALNKRESREDLHRATENGEFVIFYQPQVHLSDGTLIGAEALLRWQHPKHGLLSPATFISNLENSRYAAEVGAWVMSQACLQAAEWRRYAPDFRIGVNLFGVQSRSSALAKRVLDALSAAHLPTSALELEITENIILVHDKAQIAMFSALRKAGVGIAFDDYGTGYASLSQLKAFPLTRLKIDQSFVRGMCDSREDAAIIRAVIDLSTSFGLAIIAEGVETEEQRRRLLDKGCSEAQGYLFSRPIPAADFTALYGLSDDMTLPDKKSA